MKPKKTVNQSSSPTRLSPSSPHPRISSLAQTLQSALNSHQSGEWQQAQTLYQECLKLQPEHVQARYLLGLLFLQTQQLQEASEQLTQVLVWDSEHVGAWFNLATVQYELKNYKACAVSYRAGLRLHPESDAAWLNLGVAMKELADPEEAMRCYHQALALNANDPHIHYNLGMVMKDSNPSQALTHFHQALTLNPQLANAWFSQGGVLVRMGNLEDALASLNRAVECDSSSADVLLARANVLSQLNRLEPSLADYDHALELEANYHPAWSNRGVVLSTMGFTERALASLDRAIEIAPDFGDAYFNRAHVHLKIGNHHNARLDFDRLLALSPKTPFALGSRLHAKMLDCDWEDLPSEIEQLTLALEAGESVVNPFEFSAMVDDPHLQHQCAKIWSRAKHPALEATDDSLESPHSSPRAAQHSKIRVGYFSSDLRMHAVSQGMAPLFECHDKAQFEVFAFSLTRVAEDAVRSRIRRAVDHFIEADALSDGELAQLAKSLHLDIAIDLNGHTMGARSAIFAHRLAPIQASYLGYLGGMGAPYIDYVLADDTLIAPGRHVDFEEKIIHLPCYQVNDRSRKASAQVLTRQELGLPEKSVVFCSFNQPYKLSPSVFESWMRIVMATPGSVLYLVVSGQRARNHLKNAAVRSGLESWRLIFGERMSPADNLARYRLCNLFLDAWPYNAGVTGSDALWMGLPLLTLVGRSVPARMGASLLMAMDLPELICTTLADYEARAHALATHPEQLEALAHKIQRLRWSQPLFDAPRFTQTLERAYRDILWRAQQGLPPEHWRHSDL